jgi:hypothetical protein
MADVSRGKDLVSSLNDTETRLKKVERQLAVPRKGSVSVTGTTTSTTTDGKLLLSDTVTVVTTDTCLIHFFVLLELQFGLDRLDVGRIYVRDMEVGASADLMVIADGNNTGAEGSLPTTWAEYGSQPGLPINTYGYEMTQRPGPYAPVTITNNPSWAKAAGKHTFNLVAENVNFTMDIRKRKFFAWVQPF